MSMISSKNYAKHMLIKYEQFPKYQKKNYNLFNLCAKNWLAKSKFKILKTSKKLESWESKVGKVFPATFIKLQQKFEALI